MPATQYRTVFNGHTMVRRKLEKQKGGKVLLSIAKEHEKPKEAEMKPQKKPEDKKALRAKLAAELFRTL